MLVVVILLARGVYKGQLTPTEAIQQLPVPPPVASGD